MSMTYNSLISLISQWLQRDDASTLDQIPMFITLTEHSLSGILDNHLGLVRYATSEFIPSQPIMAKPARWRRTLSFQIGTGENFNVREALKPSTYDFATEYNKNRDETGLPVYFADYGYYDYLISPVPDLAYPYELGYIELVEPLSEAVQTNWLTDYAPVALLYGCLLQATPYLKDDERVPMWKEYYNSAIEVLKSQDIRRYTTRYSQRDSD